MVYSVASRINKAHKPLQRINAGSCLVQYYNIVSHKLISSGCKLCYIISQILRNKLDFLPWSLLFFCRTCLLSPEMFSKADPHKQLFQLLLAIQGLRKNLLYETMTQMALESANILWYHLWFASKLNLRNKCRNLILMTHHCTQIWVVLLMGWRKFLIQQNQSEVPLWLEKWWVINMEFLCSFLRHHNSVVSQNVCRFLKLWSKT